MAVNGMQETTVVGRVVSVNDRGLKLDGESDWRNFSKFAIGLEAPERGATVALTLDKAGFIRSCGPADGSAPLPAAARPLSTTTDKDRTITRLAVLKAAAEFAASKPDATAAAVLRVAESWERWVLREPDPEPELDEAF